MKLAGILRKDPIRTAEIPLDHQEHPDNDSSVDGNPWACSKAYPEVGGANMLRLCK